MLTIEKINELSQGVEYHLRSLENFTKELREVKKSLDELRQARENEYLWELSKLKTEIDQLRKELIKKGFAENKNEYEIAFASIRELLEKDDWPIAVDPKSICATEQAAYIRANSIIDLVIGERLTDKKFLDYGCGEGHVVKQACENQANAFGYDINPNIFKFEESLFLNSFDAVKSVAPFDVILMHDVLDHIQNIDPIAALIQAKSVLAPGGRIYVRNHPWSSKHGGHLYEQINKAYLHLVLDEVELTRLRGYSCQHNIRVIRPLETYKNWFEVAGLKVTSEIAIKSGEIPQFFKQPSCVTEKLKKVWEGDEAAMLANMEIDFVEYIAEPTDNSNQKIF